MAARKKLTCSTNPASLKVATYADPELVPELASMVVLKAVEELEVASESMTASTKDWGEERELTLERLQ